MYTKHLLSCPHYKNYMQIYGPSAIMPPQKTAYNDDGKLMESAIDDQIFFMKDALVILPKMLHPSLRPSNRKRACKNTFADKKLTFLKDPNKKQRVVHANLATPVDVTSEFDDVEGALLDFFANFDLPICTTDNHFLHSLFEAVRPNNSFRKITSQLLCYTNSRSCCKKCTTTEGERPSCWFAVHVWQIANVFIDWTCVSYNGTLL